MRSARPHGVVALHIGVGGLQPNSVVLPGRGLRLMNSHHHRTEKWRLGARQIVSAIGIEHRAVMFDLKEKVLYHSPRQCQASIAQQTTAYEITVPSVHFIKAAARHNVLVLEVKQSRRP